MQPRNTLMTIVLLCAIPAMAQPAAQDLKTEEIISKLTPVLQMHFQQAIDTKKMAQQLQTAGAIQKAHEAHRNMLLNVQAYLPQANAQEQNTLIDAVRLLGLQTIEALEQIAQMVKNKGPSFALAEMVNQQLKMTESVAQYQNVAGLSNINSPPSTRKEDLISSLNSPKRPTGSTENSPKIPPVCSNELRITEQNPQANNVLSSNGKAGNLYFRTVCNIARNNWVLISLPPDREALDFAVEATTPGTVVFGIRLESGSDLYHSRAGTDALKKLTIGGTLPSPNGRYQVYIDMSASQPDERITIRYIEVPK